MKMYILFLASAMFGAAGCSTGTENIGITAELQVWDCRSERPVRIGEKNENDPLSLRIPEQEIPYDDAPGGNHRSSLQGI